MKRYVHSLLAFPALILTLNLQTAIGFAQGTAFTYQGWLDNGGAPANGSFDFEFTLYTNNATGNAIAGPMTNSTVGVTDGLFTTTVDFGSVLNGGSNWLQIAVSAHGANAFSALTPRQQLTPVPCAVFANNASNLMASAQLNIIGLRIQNNTNGAPNMIGGSPVNFVSDNIYGATISGGGGTNFLGLVFTNSVTAGFGTVGGGAQNTAGGDSSTVAGGYGNFAGGVGSVVTGGYENSASGFYATVGGGEGNKATGDGATIPGGEVNVASGSDSFAAGYAAQALNIGSFVWADNRGGTPFASTANNQFLIRAAGGVGINTNAPAGALTVNTGVGTLTVRNDGPVPALVAESSSSYSGYMRLRNHLEVWPNDAGTTDGYVDIRGNNGAPNIMLDGQSGSVTCISLNQTSDRNAKQDFTAINRGEILKKVAALPITEWQYKVAPGHEHIGPVAQDFHAAFGLNGSDDKHISTVDEGGVALAAIQGLNEKLQQKDTEIAKLKNAVVELKRQEAENAQLQSQVTDLHSKVGDLQSQLESLQKAVACLTGKSAGNLALNTQPQEAR
jgi:trimeric autotransporter adhesin